MTKLRVESFTISLDGFGAGPDQDINNPLGVDDDFAARGFQNMGAWILGRNMFGPVRGPWPDESWRGWWGDNPVYHVPVFVLTHHARPPLVMEGVNLPALGYACTRCESSSLATHMVLTRQ